jgi:hypothetical protein
MAFNSGVAATTRTVLWGFHKDRLLGVSEWIAAGDRTARDLGQSVRRIMSNRQIVN